MTLRDCIGLTIKKHPDYNCEAILKTYFRIKNGIIPSDVMVNLNAFSSLVDRYKPREEISKLGRRGVISELERETNMQANRVGLLKLIEEYSTRYYTNSNNNVSKNNVANIIYDGYIMVRVNDINELKKIIDDL